MYRGRAVKRLSAGGGPACHNALHSSYVDPPGRAAMSGGPGPWGVPIEVRRPAARRTQGCGSARRAGIGFVSNALPRERGRTGAQRQGVGWDLGLGQQPPPPGLARGLSDTGAGHRAQAASSHVFGSSGLTRPAPGGGPGGVGTRGVPLDCSISSNTGLRLGGDWLCGWSEL